MSTVQITGQGPEKNQPKEQVTSGTKPQVLQNKMKGIGDNVITITELSGKFTKNFDAIGKMDVFIRFNLNTYTIETQVAQNMGKQPIWKTNVHFNYHDQKQLHITAYDKDKTQNQYMGQAKIDIKTLKQSAVQIHELTLHDKQNQSIGTIKFKYQIKLKQQPSKTAPNKQVTEVTQKKPTEIIKPKQQITPSKQINKPISQTKIQSTKKIQKTQVKPSEKKLASQKVVQQKPKDTKVTQNKPVESTKVIESKPVQTKPIQTKVVQQKQAQKSAEPTKKISQKAIQKGGQKGTQQKAANRLEVSQKPTMQKPVVIYVSKVSQRPLLSPLPQSIQNNSINSINQSRNIHLPQISRNYGDRIFDKQSSSTLQKSIHVYSVPKANRFGSGSKYQGEPSYYVDTCFKPNATKGVGFGFGNKKQFPQWLEKNMKENPAPGAYFDDINKSQRKGPTFGISHKYYEKVTIPKDVPKQAHSIVKSHQRLKPINRNQ